MKDNKKNMWISIVIIIILFITIIFFVLYFKKRSIDMTGKVRVHSFLSYTDQGIVYDIDNYFWFMDVSSGKNIVLCDKPNCRHLDSNCNGYKDFSIRGLSIYNDRLFYVRQESDRTATVYQANTNSTNRRPIVKLREMQNNTSAIYMGNYLLYAYRNSFVYEEDSIGSSGTLEKPIAGIAIVNLKKRKVIYVAEKEDYDATILHPYIYDNKLYYLYLYLDVKIDYSNDIMTLDTDFIDNHTFYQLYCYDMNTNTEEIIYEGQDIKLEDYEGYNAFIVKSEGECNKIYAFNLLTQEKTLLVEDKHNLRCFADGDRLIYYSYNSNSQENTKYYYYYYDLSSETVMEIGESNDFAVISEVMDDIIYLSYYDKSTGELQGGYIHKDDFYNFEFDKLVAMRYG